VIARGAGEAAFMRAGPFWAAMATLAAVSMGPTALTPADLVAALESSRGLRVGCWALWLAGVVPAARAALARPDLIYLRSLPIAPALWWLCLGAIVLAVQLPWMAVVWAGGGGEAGLATGFGAAGISAALVVRAARPVERIVSAAPAAATAALILAPGPGWAVAAAGAASLALALPIAWRRVPAAAVRRGGRVRFPGPAALALAVYHGLALWRRDGQALGRGVGLALLGGAVAGLIGVGPIGSLAIAALTLTAAVFGLVAPVARARREASWMLDASGTAQGARAVAAGAVLAGCGVLAGAAHASLALGLGASGSAALAGFLAGIGLGVAATPTASWASRPSGVDGQRVVTAGVLVALVLLVVLSGVAATQAGP
jgi:hypothetical protein